MQTMYATIAGATRTRSIPPPSKFIMPGVRWGAFDELLTPAYWCGQAWQHQLLGNYSDIRLGRTLREEMAACLLGGFGMPAELALAAYVRIRERGLLVGVPPASTIEAALSEPIHLGGSVRRYRFPRQKAKYLAASLQRFETYSESDDDISLRDDLAAFPGIGLKTASWIVRNYRRSDSVAVLDVHILRAGRIAGIFKPEQTVEKNYRKLEHLFIQFAKAIQSPAHLLDGMMWDYMRRLHLPQWLRRPTTSNAPA